LFACCVFAQGTYAETEKRIAALAQQNAGIARLVAVGTSAGGRRIHALEIAAPGPVAPAARPAVFVGANIAGFHSAGTEAALVLAERLLARKGDALLQTRTFYILPALNPDAHEAMAGRLRWRNGLNAAKLDRDRDGLTGEDGPDDLNGDGRITQMRIADPHGEYMVDADGKTLRKADPLKGEKGAYRLLTEGNDDDGDGQFNEDPAGGYAPDKNFAHAWPDTDPEAGPFPSSTPEARAVMDYLLARRNVAVAFLFGPANNLLDLPKGVGAAVELGQMRVTPTAGLANALGLEPRPYTVDEAFQLLQGSPVLAQAGGTRESLASVLGAPQAMAPDGEDTRYYQSLADDYKKALEAAGLDSKRPGKQSGGGGLQNWLYYHYSALAVELDVWGATKPADFAAWTPVTLADGTKAEVGGLDPLAELTPGPADLAKASGAHADFILQAAAKLAKVEVLSLEAKPLASGLWRVKAVAGNSGAWPTHTKHAVRSRAWLPVRLKLTLPAGASLVSGNDQVASERLTGGTGTLQGEWVVRASRGARLAVEALTQNAGTDRKELSIQ
jgi:hypothetical protein